MVTKKCNFDVRRQRFGYTALELTVACALLVTVISMTAMALGRISEMRRDLAAQVLAEQTVANVVEEVHALEFDEITPDRLSSIVLDPETQRWLPAAELNFDIHDLTSAEMPIRRVVVTLRWIRKAANSGNLLQASVLRSRLKVDESNDTGDEVMERATDV